MLDRIGEANVERLNSQPEPPRPAVLQEGLQLIAEAETIGACALQSVEQFFARLHVLGAPAQQNPPAPDQPQTFTSAAPTITDADRDRANFGDGVDELLLEGSFYNMGTLASSVRLVELKDKRLRVVKEFEGVYENPCDGDAGAHVTAGVTSYRPSGASAAQSLRVSLYRAPCPANEKEQPDPQSFAPVEDEKRNP